MTGPSGSAPSPTPKASGVPAWAAIWVVVAACMWAGNQFTPLLSLYRRELGYDEIAVTVFLGAYVAGLAPALIGGARLSDRYGRRRMLTIGLAAGLASSAVLALSASSAAGLIGGRVLAGIAVGLATAVGSSWISELSRATAPPSAGPRRASIAVTGGSLVGAAIAGSLAQFTTAGTLTPYLVHIAVCLLGIVLVRRAPDRSRIDDGTATRSPARATARFVGRTALTAPWLFIAASIAYGYLPVALSDDVGELALGYATLLSTVTLAVAASTQALTKKFERLRRHGIVIGAAFFVVGFLLAAAAITAGSPALGIVAAVVTGAGFGSAHVAGVATAQAGDVLTLATRTGTFYALAFSGFLAPLVLTLANAVVPVPALLVGLAVVCVVTTTLSLLRPATRA